eukprot:scaffold33996_cov19-Prasinocladus_malaysianus.AAC.3
MIAFDRRLFTKLCTCSSAKLRRALGNFLLCQGPAEHPFSSLQVAFGPQQQAKTISSVTCFGVLKA